MEEPFRGSFGGHPESSSALKERDDRLGLLQNFLGCTNENLKGSPMVSIEVPIQKHFQGAQNLNPKPSTVWLCLGGRAHFSAFGAMDG